MYVCFFFLTRTTRPRSCGLYSRRRLVVCSVFRCGCSLFSVLIFCCACFFLFVSFFFGIHNFVFFSAPLTRHRAERWQRSRTKHGGSWEHVTRDSDETKLQRLTTASTSQNKQTQFLSSASDSTFSIHLQREKSVARGASALVPAKPAV